MRPTANDCRGRLMACAIGAWACVLGNAVVCADAASHPGKVQTGLASFYGRAFDGKKTASGGRFDSDELTAAHPTYPLGTRVRVTNRENGRSVVVRITDRGPTRPNRRDGVVIDLSRAAATRLGMRKEGRAPVRVRVLEWGSDEPSTHSDKEAKAGASGE